MAAKSSSESHGRIYPAMRNDPDYLDFLVNDRMRHFYDHIFCEESGFSGITRINPENLSSVTKLPVAYIKNLLLVPNRLYDFYTPKNILWCKKWFFYSQKMPGNPASYIKAIVREYQNSADWVSAWKGFFEINQETLNAFYLDKFADHIKILEEGKASLTKNKLLGIEAIEELFHIKQKLFGEKPRKEISFSNDMMSVL